MNTIRYTYQTLPVLKTVEMGIKDYLPLKEELAKQIDEKQKKVNRFHESQKRLREKTKS